MSGHKSALIVMGTSTAGNLGRLGRLGRLLYIGVS